MLDDIIDTSDPTPVDNSGRSEPYPTPTPKQNFALLIIVAIVALCAGIYVAFTDGIFLGISVFVMPVLLLGMCFRPATI